MVVLHIYEASLDGDLHCLNLFLDFCKASDD